MDIWDWVTNLRKDLAKSEDFVSFTLIDAVSRTACNWETERAKAIAPQAKSMAKALKNPWLEVFVRHWELRNRLGNLCEGQSALVDTVSLFEFAQRQECQDCPQSVCVTQDMAACYGNVDGPGWAAERIAVCEETLAKIDTSWPCYQCLVIEKAYGLRDSGALDEALSFTQQQYEKLFPQYPGAGELHNINELHIFLLLEAKHYEKALELLEKTENDTKNYSFLHLIVPRQLEKALALAGLGRYDEASAILPAWDRVVPFYRMLWLRTMVLLFQDSPGHNNWEFAQKTYSMLQQFDSVGAHRNVIETAALSIPLALARDAPSIARIQLAIAQRHLPLLHQDLGASAKLEQLAKHIDATPALKSPDPGYRFDHKLVNWLRFFGNDPTRISREHELEWLLQAFADNPDDEELIVPLAKAFHHCAAVDEELKVLWEDVHKHPTEIRESTHYLVELLLELGQLEDVLRLGQVYKQRDVLAAALWCKLRYAEKMQNWDNLLELCFQLIITKSDVFNVLPIYLNALKEHGDLIQAAAQLESFIKKGKSSDTLLWNHMAIASAAQDWLGAKRSAVSLKLEKSTEPNSTSDFDGQFIIVGYTEGGKFTSYVAVRTGPITARIAQPTRSDCPQHVDDLVIFANGPLAVTPTAKLCREEEVPSFEFIYQIKSGGFQDSWAVAGGDPGADVFKTFCREVTQRGWRIWKLSSNDYQISSKENEQPKLPGVYFLIAQPEGDDLEQLSHFLEQTCSSWKYRWCWPELAACSDESDKPVEFHEELSRRYGIRNPLY